MCLNQKHFQKGCSTHFVKLITKSSQMITEEESEGNQTTQKQFCFILYVPCTKKGLKLLSSEIVINSCRKCCKSKGTHNSCFTTSYKQINIKKNNNKNKDKTSVKQTKTLMKNIDISTKRLITNQNEHFGPLMQTHCLLQLLNVNLLVHFLGLFGQDGGKMYFMYYSNVYKIYIYSNGNKSLECNLPLSPMRPPVIPPDSVPFFQSLFPRN